MGSLIVHTKASEQSTGLQMLFFLFSSLKGNTSREDEILVQIHIDKVAYEEQIVLDKMASSELQEKTGGKTLLMTLRLEEST